MLLSSNFWKSSTLGPVSLQSRVEIIKQIITISSSSTSAILLFSFSLTFKIIQSLCERLKLTLTFSNKILDFWLNFRHLWEHKQKFDSFCSCINEPESTKNYSLSCHSYLGNQPESLEQHLQFLFLPLRVQIPPIIVFAW